MYAIPRAMQRLRPREGTLERTLLDLLREAGPAGLPLHTLPGIMGITPDLLEFTIRNLQTGMYASEGDDCVEYDA